MPAERRRGEGCTLRHKFGKERYIKDIKEINNIQELQKKSVEFHRSAQKGHVWKESGVMKQGRRDMEVGTLLLGKDKSKVIADKVLSYF